MKAASAVVLLMLVGAGCATSSKESPATEPGDPTEEVSPAESETETDAEAEAETPEASGAPQAGSELPAEAATLSLEDATAHCVKLHEEGAACADEFASMLVQLRIDHDPRFASVSLRPGVREATVAKAKEEVLADGTGPLEARQARCAGYAQNGPPVPADEPEEVERCYAMDDCQQKVECLRPAMERRMLQRGNAAPAR